MVQIYYNNNVGCKVSDTKKYWWGVQTGAKGHICKMTQYVLWLIFQLQVRNNKEHVHSAAK